MIKKALYALFILILLVGTGYVFFKNKTEVRISANFDAEPIHSVPMNSTAVKLYASNKGQGDAHAFIKITMPIYPEAKMDGENDGRNLLLVYTPQSPWALVEERVVGDTLESVYYFGALRAAGDSSYLITSWTFNNFHSDGKMCGLYKWDELEAGIERSKFDGIDISPLKTRATDPKEIWADIIGGSR